MYIYIAQSRKHLPTVNIQFIHLIISLGLQQVTKRITVKIRIRQQVHNTDIIVKVLCYYSLTIWCYAKHGGAKQSNFWIVSRHQQRHFVILSITDCSNRPDSRLTIVSRH